MYGTLGYGNDIWMVAQELRGYDVGALESGALKTLDMGGTR